MKDEGKNVTVISALDYIYEDFKVYGKKTDDVLDIILRQRYKDLGITFFSMADLKVEKPEPQSLLRIFKDMIEITSQPSPYQLIKAIVETDSCVSIIPIILKLI